MPLKRNQQLLSWRWLRVEMRLNKEKRNNTKKKNIYYVLLFYWSSAIVSILLYGCTTWMLTKLIEKKLEQNCTIMRQAIVKKFWKQNPAKQRLYGHLPPISKTIQIRRTAGEVRWTHKWRSPHGRESVGRPTRTYLQQLCVATGYSLDDLPESMDDRDEWRERIRKIRLDDAYVYIYIFRQGLEYFVWILCKELRLHPPKKGVLGVALNDIRGWNSISTALRSVELLFIAITTMFEVVIPVQVL